MLFFVWLLLFSIILFFNVSISSIIINTSAAFSISWYISGILKAVTGNVGDVDDVDDVGNVDDVGDVGDVDIDELGELDNGKSNKCLIYLIIRFIILCVYIFLH